MSFGDQRQIIRIVGKESAQSADVCMFLSVFQNLSRYFSISVTGLISNGNKKQI